MPRRSRAFPSEASPGTFPPYGLYFQFLTREKQPGKTREKPGFLGRASGYYLNGNRGISAKPQRLFGRLWLRFSEGHLRFPNLPIPTDQSSWTLGQGGLAGLPSRKVYRPRRFFPHQLKSLHLAIKFCYIAAHPRGEYLHGRIPPSGSMINRPRNSTPDAASYTP